LRSRKKLSKLKIQLARQLLADDVFKNILATKGVLTPFQQKTGLFGQSQFPASMMRVHNVYAKDNGVLE
jgi:hypothetical protein